MNSRKSWTCDGVSKNSKQYPGLYKPHKPYENYGAHCQICGKPREAMIANQPIVILPQPVEPLANNINVARRANPYEKMQLLLVLAIPIISVIVAIYVMLNTLGKPRTEVAQSYENIDYGIKMQYPQGWQIQDKQDATLTGDIAILFPSEKTKLENCQATITIAVDNFSEAPPSLQEYKNSVIQKITALNRNTNMTDESASVKLSNSNAYKLVYTRQDGTCSLQVMEIGTIRNNKAYYITYKASTNTYSNLLKPVEEMINNFEIKEVNK